MTILTEIESTINSKPLTFVSSEELEETLNAFAFTLRKTIVQLTGREQRA